ncbi:MAG: hypothetical protein IKG30_02180 [Clostridiales bacterium]|nr:hypothetical protein [Clostridiales bacterium]
MQVFAIIGAALLFIAAVFEVLLVAGLPLGEFTMGGRYKVLPPMMRGAAVFSLLTQVFAGLILLQAAGFMGMWFTFGVTRIICYVFGGFFVINTVMNFFSTSKKEKFVMTPLAAIEAACFLVTAIMMK